MGAPSALLTRGLVYLSVPASPGTATLAVANNGDGTGLATITASVPFNGTNVLYRAAWTGNPQEYPTWTTVGSMIGNGTMALSGAGFWLWRLSTNGSYSDLVYQPITNSSTQSPQSVILSAVVTGIRTIALTDVISANVTGPNWIPRALSKVETATLPKILVALWDRESFPGVLNNKDDIGIPCIVVIVDKLQQDNTLNFNRDTLWRWQIMSYFRFQGLTGSPPNYGIYNCIPEPDVQVNPEWFDKKSLYVSALGLRFITRTVRGLV